MTFAVDEKQHIMVFLQVKHNLARLLEKLFLCHNSKIYRVNKWQTRESHTKGNARPFRHSLQRQVFLASVLVDELDITYSVHKKILVAWHVPSVQVVEWVFLHLPEQGDELCNEVSCHSKNLVRSVLERHDSPVICHNHKI